MRQIGFSLLFCLSFINDSNAQQPVRAAVEPRNGKPSLVINGTAVNPMFYSLTDVPGGRWSWEELPSHNLKTFCNAGFDLIQVDIFFDHVWMEDGSMDMTLTQKQLRGVLDVCPRAKIVIRFHVNSPKWWQKKFPEENTVYADRPPKPDYDWGVQRVIEDDEETPVRFSLASEKWRTESGERFAEYLTRLAALPEGDAVAGFHLAAGVYGEWHYWGFLDNEPDISEPMQKRFRRWLTGRYKSDLELQRAWNDPHITLATARVPGVEDRRHTTAGIFRDPLKEKKVIDYYECQHSVVAQDIIHFCRIVREHWPRPAITGAFYGYFYAVFGREAAGGHLALNEVLSSPYIDYLSAPGTYYPQTVAPGDPYRSRSLITSVRLHGKLWLDEMDQQPPLVPLKDTAFAKSVSASIGTVRRNVVAPFVHGGGLWFYDFGPSGFNGGKRLADHGSWGWWDEPSLMHDIAALKKVLDQYANTSFSRDADVLLVHDDETLYHTGSDRSASFLGHWTNNWVPAAIYRSGVLHDVIDLADLPLVDIDRYKVVVFMNTWRMTTSDRKLIRERVAAEGRHLVFLYAPGYSDGKTLSVDFINDVTSMTLRQFSSEHYKPIVMTDSTLTNSKLAVWDRAVEPLFVVDDKKATSLGIFEGSSAVGAARKSGKKHTSWFFAFPPADVKLWRNLFASAGAHIYGRDGDVMYGGSGILSVHSAKGGERRIKLKSGAECVVRLTPGATVLVDSETGKVLMK